MRELKQIQAEIMALYGKLTANQRVRFLDFVLFLNEVCDNKNDPPQGNADRSLGRPQPTRAVNACVDGPKPTAALAADAGR